MDIRFVHGICVVSMYIGVRRLKKTTVWQRQEPESDVVSVALEAVVATNNEFRFAIGKCSWI